ncbi:MAG: GNAT family N-acetyltransferase [Methanobacteriaceae archaeon]|nr:GNAT family N-acetyltransferase [Methanobacteriaceae archaeon]
MIIKATINDIEVIMKLWKEMMDFHEQLSNLYELKTNAKDIYSSYIKELLKDPNKWALVYEKNNEICAYLIAEESELPPVYKKNQLGVILELAVTKKHQNKNIGQQMLQNMEKIFLDKGITRIGCTVSCFNNVSKNFWFKNGFEPYNMMCFKNL